MIVFAYQVAYASGIVTKTREDMVDVVSGFKQYNTVAEQIKQKLSERKKLLAEKQKLSPLQFSENRRLNARIAKLTEDLEELKSEKEQTIFSFGKSDDKGMKDVKSWINGRETQIRKAEAAEAKYGAELDKALEEYHDLESRAKELDPEKLKAARLSLRPEEEKRAVSKLEDAYGNSYDYDTMREAENQVADLLDEARNDNAPISLRETLRQKQKDAQQRDLPQRKKARDLER
jgi:uncharacterized phage infection (PIP) family protein YhgE